MPRPVGCFRFLLTMTDENGSGQISLGRRLWAVLLTGIPFGIFKVGGGMAAYEDINPGLGVAVILWGVLDVLLNLLSIPLSRHVAPCFLANVGVSRAKRCRPLTIGTLTQSSPMSGRA